MTRLRIRPRWIVAVRIFAIPIGILGYIAYWPAAAFLCGWEFARSDLFEWERQWDRRYAPKEPQP